MSTYSRSPLLFAALVAAGCATDTSEDAAALTPAELTGPARRTRSEKIRDVAAQAGLTNGALLAGIAQVETGLAHCWSEATWACQGPFSASCNGPVIAGAGDGPCADQQGGLGMFQFDGGTYAQTLARDGEAILLLEGNIAHAIDFVAGIVRQEVAGVDTRAEAIAWLNSIPIAQGKARFDEWTAILACRYNGRCGSAEQAAKYGDATLAVSSEFGPGFWQVARPRSAPALAYDNGDGTMKIYRWTSTGAAFARVADYQSGSFSLGNVGDRVAAGDVDGDGHDDIVMAYQYVDGTFGFYVFTGGIHSEGPWYQSGPFNLDRVGGRLVVDDFNGDGRAEPALVYDLDGVTMRIYRWLSTGSSFERTTDYTSGTFRMSQVGDRVASGDVDGDGKADIVMAYQHDDGTFSYYVFKGGMTSSGRWYDSGQFSLSKVAGRLVVDDFDGDGRAEPAAVYDLGGMMRIYRWRSTGSSFARATDYTSGSFSLGNVHDRVTSHDVDGDGKADVVMAYQLIDGTFSYYVFDGGLTSAGRWYDSGSYNLGFVAGRFVLGHW